jgi:hypothetical protein
MSVRTLKRFDYKVSVEFVMRGIPVHACFGVTAVPLTQAKALKIARVLYPRQRKLKVSLTNLADRSRKARKFKWIDEQVKRLLPHEDPTNKSGIGEG